MSFARQPQEGTKTTPQVNHSRRLAWQVQLPIVQGGR